MAVCPVPSDQTLLDTELAVTVAGFGMVNVSTKANSDILQMAEMKVIESWVGRKSGSAGLIRPDIWYPIRYCRIMQAISGKVSRIVRPDIRHPARKARSGPTLIYRLSLGQLGFVYERS